MKKLQRILLFIFGFLINSCVNDSEFSVPNTNCISPNIEATHTIPQIKEMAGFGILEFKQDFIIEGYIVSSDAAGNFYKTLVMQDAIENPTSGIQIAIDKTNLYAEYPVGSKVFLKLKGLAIGYGRSGLQIGIPSGNTIERIPVLELNRHLYRSCEVFQIVPKIVAVKDISDVDTDILISFENVQFKASDLGKTFANLEDTNTVHRVLEEVDNNCNIKSKIDLETSGFSDFKSQVLPEEKGKVTGVIHKDFEDFSIVVRNIEDVDFLEKRCAIDEVLESTVSFAQLEEMYQGELVEFGVSESLVFKGYVISSDKEKNFEKKIVVQDAIENPTGGIQILIDSETTYEAFEIGDEVFVSLNRLYMDRINGDLIIGYPKEGKIVEIEEEDFLNYIFKTGNRKEIIPVKATLELKDVLNPNTLVTIENVQLVERQRGNAFAFYSGEDDGVKVIETCGVASKINVSTKGKATFSYEQFPLKNGSITGVVSGNNSILQIRNLKDVSFDLPYQECTSTIPKVLITEIADPRNSVGARFVELYNAGISKIDLSGWRLNKYINGSVKVSGDGFLLSGTLNPGEFMIVAGNDFETLFEKKPEFATSYISGNGDDVYQLVDVFGEVQDVYGKIGEDGTDKSWEYTDGKAIRKKEITTPSKIFNLNEWDVFTKANGKEQNAPENFSPWERNSK